MKSVPALALVLACAPQAFCALEIEYRVRLPDAAPNSIDVLATFSGLPENQQTLTLDEAPAIAFAKMPESTQTELPRARNAAGAELEVQRTGPFAWSIATGGAPELKVEYRVPLTHRMHPIVLAANDDYEFPYREECHGLLVGGPIFLEPRGSRATPRIHLDFGDTPFVTSLTRQTDGSYSPREGLALQQAIIAFGRLTQHSFEVDGMAVRVVFLPGQEFLAERCAQMIERIVRLEVEIFGITPSSQFLFVFALGGTQGFGGTAKNDALLMSVAASQFSSEQLVEAIAHLVAHEFFHTWALSLYRDDLRFVNEGFTDYFAWIVLGRLGILPPERLARTLGERIAAYVQSAEASGISLVEAGGSAFFAGGAAHTQIYAGGLVVASILDNLLRLKAHGDAPRTLDEFMRVFNNGPLSLAAKSPMTDTPSASTIDDLIALIGKSLGEVEAQRFASLVREVGPPRVVDAYAAAGLRVTATERAAVADLRGNLAGTKLLDLDPACAAHTIGLRPGDELLIVNGVAVTTPKATYSAFAKPQSGRFVIKLRRDGAEQVIDTAVPRITEFGVPLDALGGFAAVK